MSNYESIDDFIEQMLADKGLPALDPDVHEQLVADLGDRLTKLINRRVIESLPEKALPEFESITKEQPLNEQKMQNFIKHNISDLRQVTLDAMVEFRSLYLGYNA